MNPIKTHVEQPNFSISIPCTTIRKALQEKIDHLSKPKGSLGMLENIALEIGYIQQSLHPSLQSPTHIIFGADHGIEQEGVSFTPREVTWQQMIHFTKGGGGVNIFCDQHHFNLKVVDTGIDYDFHPDLSIINRKIAYGTKNFLHEPAMSEKEMYQALWTGIEMVDNTHAEGCNIICFGEMGIANTSPSAIWMSILENIDLKECVGAGSGLCNAGITHKLQVILQAVDNYKKSMTNTKDTWTIMRYFGGFEMVAAVGAMLHAAEKKMIIMIDGFIMSSCLLMAKHLHPAVMNYAICCHEGDEKGHKRLLQALGKSPILHLGMRLGEGTGALCAYPILQSAVKMINDMDSFDNGKVSDYIHNK